MKVFYMLILLVSVNNILGHTSDDAANAFTIPLPRVCVNSKRDIYLNLIKNSNRNFISAYQRFMPKGCNYSFDVVKIVEDYRNAANYVAIFLNKRVSTHEHFNEVVKLYDAALKNFNEAIGEMAATKRLTNICHNSLMMMQRAIVTTGEGLVTSSIVTYNRKCPLARRRDHIIDKHRPIASVSNHLN